ncbi:MAG: sodium:calcium antiporter, partial [Halobacteria archaeon]|nr:sodium:calcium antiporter [Halobacteria archaeon]
MKGLVERLEHPLSAFFVTFAATVPWIALVLLGATPEGEIARVALTGVSVLGAAFILAWAAETAEEDVPRAFALAVLAVLAVAPEYAVDALYAWKAGAGKATAEACNQLSPSAIEAGGTELAEACQAANLAIANMTGANRILIGIGWSGIALYSIYKATSTDDRSVEERDGYLNDRVKLDKDISLEILFLAVATLYAFFVPIADIGAFDMVFLVGLYVVYIYFALQSPKAEEPKVGVPAYLTDLKRRKRIPVVVLLFVYSGIVILVAVEPFAEGLEHIGLRFGISPFLMIQWVAPLASESPELIVTAYLVNKARSTAAFNALISSKLNQWTLL